MNPRESYPHGVPCFVDLEREDVDAAAAFYGGLFGWSFDAVSPPGAPRFLAASLNGLRVAGIGEPTDGAASNAWNTYVSVDDADATAAKVTAAGGTVLAGPLDVGPAGRMAAFADPQGAQFRVWQAGASHGAQLVNVPGSWNWSDYEASDLEAAKAFYGSVFGWEYQEVDLGGGPSWMIRVPGYGQHLEALSPGTLERHSASGAPEGFSDAIGWLLTAKDEARWAVTFTVADADATAAKARELGGTVVTEPFDAPWVRLAVLRDPEGATLTVGKFQPPED